MNNHRTTGKLRRDVNIVIASIIVSYGAYQLGGVAFILDQLSALYGISSFAAGIFYSSILTVAPATVMLAELSTRSPVWQVALAGGLGAMIGDLLVFRFLRSTIAQHVQQWATARLGRSRLRTMQRRISWPFVILGGAVIASPLPDEIGLAMMGITRLPERWLMLISFGANSVGIYVIGLIANAVDVPI